MNHNYISGYSIKNDLFTSSTNFQQTPKLTPSNKFNRLNDLGMTTSVEKVSYRNANTNENRRLGEEETIYYDMESRHFAVGSNPKESFIISGQNFEIK